MRRPEPLLSLPPVETYLIAILLIFGGLACFLLPVGTGYDEETHLVRVWEMSTFTFLPNERLGKDLLFPKIYWDISYRRPFLVRPVAPDFWQRYGSLSIESKGFMKIETRSVYAPPLLLPQAAVMDFLARLRWPALPIFYLIRWAGLLSYILLTWLAVRIIPYGKWILAFLATTPVAILQAATISADSISNGIGFLFLAGTLALAQRDRLTGREWLSMAALFLILYWGKTNLLPLALLPFLLLRPSQFQTRRGYWLLLVFALIVGGVEAVGWNVIAYDRLGSAAGQANPVQQIEFILKHPLSFLMVLLRDIRLHGYQYWKNGLAIYGYNYWPVPPLVWPICTAGLLTVLLADGAPKSDKRTPWLLAGVFVLTYLATIALLYVTFTPPGSDFVSGVQGRYFVAVLPPGFLALSFLPVLRRRYISLRLPLALSMGALVIYLVGIYLSYYVPCGSQYYQPGYCYQPVYKNWAPNALYSAPISDQFDLSQEVRPECDGMAEVRVWVNAAQADPTAQTEFVLTPLDSSLEIARAVVVNRELPHGGWYALHFAPQWDSARQYYLLTIRSSQADGPQIALSLRPEYPEVQLYLNGEASDRDAIFQIGCVAGWEKLFLRREQGEAAGSELQDRP